MEKHELQSPAEIKQHFSFYLSISKPMNGTKRKNFTGKIQNE